MFSYLTVMFQRLLLAALVPACLLAQIDAGAIVGVVKDQSGAAIPKVKVVITNLATQLNNETQTNDSGEYQVVALIPGHYSVKVNATGFTPAVIKDVEIHVQSRQSADFTLKLGNVSESVEVQASAPVLDTERADVGGVVNSRQIVDLPLNGRRYSDLALLEPGVQKRPDADTANAAPDRFSANGNLETQNYFSLDGVDNNSGSTNLQEGSVQVVQPPPDALQEFRVQTRTYSAEFGTSAGAVVNASIKSGTNQFHGNLYEFLRNDKLDANSFFNNERGVDKGHFSQNQFGGTFGGPIRKNKTFFFGDAQYFTSRKATSVTSTVPTPLMKTGNFTELPYALTAPKVAGQSGCLTGNIIAASCIDPTGQKLLNLFPDPNIPSAVAVQGAPGSWTGAPNYLYQYSIPNDTYSWDARVDHSINDRNQIFGRFSNYHVDRQDPPWTSNAVAGNGDFAAQYKIRGYSTALSWNDTLSPSLLNELRAGFNRMNAHSDPIGLTLGTSLASQYGLSGLPQGPSSTGLPPININGLQRLGSSPWRPQYQISQVWQILDSLSWLRGSHSVKFGYEFRHASNTFQDIRSPQGEITSDGIYTASGNFGVPDFLLGDIDAIRFTTPLVVHNYIEGHSFYAQDTWRVRSNLTVNYGLRYELFSPLLNHQNQVSNFSSANGGSIVTAASNASGWYAQSLIHPDKNDFAPRLGFSYQPLSKLVVRGGYGVFYQHTNRIGSESVLNLNPPFLTDTSISQVLGSTTPVFQLRNGFPSSAFGNQTVDLTSLQIRAQDPNERSGYVHQTSFGTQYQLTGDTILDLTYVGNFGRKLNRLRNANQGQITGYDSSGNPIVAYNNPNINNNATGQHAFLEYATNDGNSNYNGLLVSLRKRIGKGLGYGINYTYSHGTSDFVDNLTGGAFPQNAYNYAAERGDSPFDIRHRFVANAIWQLPIGTGGMLLQDRGKLSNAIGGWQLNTIVTLQTGTAFSVTAPDRSGTGSFFSRANCLSDPFQGATSDRSSIVDGGSGFFINPAAFSIPANGTFGNCGPRNLHGPGIENVDFSLFKSFQVRESMRFEFRGEFFNAFNHANFSNPSSDITNPGSFGKIYSTRLDPREAQLALKFYF